MKIYYTVTGTTERSSCKVDCIASAEDFEYDGYAVEAAQQCAEDYYNNGGHELENWPIVITLYQDKTSPPVGEFKVELDFSPVFIASKRAAGGEV